MKIPVCEPTLIGNEMKYVQDCIQSNWISSAGEYITRFEEGFSEYCNRKHGVSCSNGTTALHLALAALGVGQGDEVILPALTNVACMYSVMYTGATPIIVDSDFGEWNIDVRQIESKITKRTKVIMPVHIYGHPVEMDIVKEIAEKHSLYVVEDCAEAHAAKYKNKMIGSFGDISCFSFFGNKIITTGEGGMIMTDNDEIGEKAKSLRNLGHSKERRFLHDTLAFNYRITNMQAAIGLGQLENIEKLAGMRRKVAQKYIELLKDEDNIILPPSERKGDRDVYWMFSILCKNMNCLRLQKLLEKSGIDTRTFFIPMNMQPEFTKRYKKVSCPNAERLSEMGLNLPSASNLSEDKIQYVVDSLRKAISE